MNFETNWEFIPFKHWWSEQLIYLVILLLCLWLSGFFKPPQMGAKISYRFFAAVTPGAPTQPQALTSPPVPTSPPGVPTSAPSNTQPPSPRQPFSDVPIGSQYYAATLAMFDAGIMLGPGGGRFDLTSIINRGDMALVLARTLGSNPGSNYDAAIQFLIDRGITAQTPQTFDKEGVVTRGTLSLFVGRAIIKRQDPNQTFGLPSLAIPYLQSQGVTIGCSATDNACFNQPVNRAEIAHVMYKALPKLR